MHAVLVRILSFIKNEMCWWCLCIWFITLNCRPAGLHRDLWDRCVGEWTVIKKVTPTYHQQNIFKGFTRWCSTGFLWNMFSSSNFEKECGAPSDSILNLLYLHIVYCIETHTDAHARYIKKEKRRETFKWLNKQTRSTGGEGTGRHRVRFPRLSWSLTTAENYPECRWIIVASNVGGFSRSSAQIERDEIYRCSSSVKHRLTLHYI